MVRLVNWLRGSGAVVLCLASTAESAVGQFNVAPAVHQPLPAAAPSVEIYYGVRKVTPLMPLATPAPAEAVLPASAKSGPHRPAESPENLALADTLKSLQVSSKLITAAAVNWLGKMSHRTAAAETRTIVLTQPAPVREPEMPAPLAPWLTPAMPLPAAASVPATPAALPAPPQSTAQTASPSIVVLRDAGLTPASGGLQLSPVGLLGMGGAIAGLGLLAAWWLRRPRTAEPNGTASPLTATGPRLLNSYSIGEIPKTAERFDLGPTYQDQQQQKVQQDAASAASVVEQILQQNLALLAEIRPPAEESLPPEPDETAHAERLQVETVAVTPAAELAARSLEPFQFSIPLTKPLTKPA